MVAVLRPARAHIYDEGRQRIMATLVARMAEAPTEHRPRVWAPEVVVLFLQLLLSSSVVSKACSFTFRFSCTSVCGCSAEVEIL